MHAALPSSQMPVRQRLVVTAGIVVGLVGIAAAVFPLLAVPAMTLGIVTFLAQPPASLPSARLARWLLLASVPFVVVAMLRFTIEEAMPGIVEGGHRALVTRAIAKLRVVRFAEDVAREQAFWDPDGDGIGSALTLEELTGKAPLRGAKEAPRGLLDALGSYAETPVGKAALADGYAFLVYLPAKDGRGLARSSDDVDDERAERRFVAYAWPLEDGAGDRPVVFLDEHERVLMLKNDESGPRYIGLDRPPPFDAALLGPSLDAAAAEDAIGQDGGNWRRWKDKRAREHLPGDRPAR